MLGDKPVAEQSSKLVSIEHSPSVLCLLCTGKSIRIRIIGKDVAGDLDIVHMPFQRAMIELENLIKIIYLSSALEPGSRGLSCAKGKVQGTGSLFGVRILH